MNYAGGGGLEVFAYYAPITIDYTNLHKHSCKQLPFGIFPHVDLIHYLDNSATAPTFLPISSKKVEKLKRGCLNKSGERGAFFEKK